jgi:hypothetical protein
MAGEIRLSGLRRGRASALPTLPVTRFRQRILQPRKHEGARASLRAFRANCKTWRRSWGACRWFLRFPPRAWRLEPIAGRLAHVPSEARI